MTPDEPGLIPKDEALALIEGLERSARRTRPFFIYGMALIVAGFVSFSVYLYQDREHERGVVNELRAQKARIDGALHNALRFANAPPSEANSARIRQALGQALGQTAQLDAITNQIPSVGTPPPAALPQEAVPQPERLPPRPEYNTTTAGPAAPEQEEEEEPEAVRERAAREEVRFVIYVSESSQIPQATALANELRLALPRGRRMRVTEVTVVPIEGEGARGDNSLRCFDFFACDFVDIVAGIANSRLASPRLEARWMNGAPPRGTGVRSYQIWFAPGPITLSAQP